MPTSRAAAAAVAILSLALAACGAKRVPEDSVKVPRDRFPPLAVVAVAPIDASPELGELDDAKARFIASIEERLRGAGIAVVPPAEVGPALAAALEATGGVYDPRTGELDLVKLRAARAEALATIAARHGRVDALLIPELAVVRATLHNDRAAWHGVEERAGTTAWKAALGVTHSGTVRALSLTVRLTGEGGTYLYGSAGGIRLVEKIGVRGDRVPVPVPELFLDEERNARAVSLALDALVEAARDAAATAPPPVATIGTAPTSPPRAEGPRR